MLKSLGAAAGGSGTPAGSTTEVQWNNAGAFGASSAFTFTTATNRIALGTLGTPGIIGAPIASAANGAAFTVKAADGEGTNKSGGAVNITAGNATGNGNDGNVNISTGVTGGGTTSHVNITTNKGVLAIGDADIIWTVDSAEIAALYCISENAEAATQIGLLNDESEILSFGAQCSASSPQLTGLPTGQCAYLTWSNASAFFIGIGTSGNIHSFLDSDRNFVVGATSNAAGDTNGFLYVPLLVGNQTGVPANLTGNYAASTPIRFQNNGGVYSLKAYINGGWRSVALL